MIPRWLERLRAWMKANKEEADFITTELLRRKGVKMLDEYGASLMLLALGAGIAFGLAAAGQTDFGGVGWLAVALVICGGVLVLHQTFEAEKLRKEVRRKASHR